MRIMTSCAAFEAHRRMFEGKGPPLIAVTAEAAGLVRIEHAAHRRPGSAVRIVAVDTAHRPFRHPVMIGFLELRPDVLMAAGTQAVDLDRLHARAPGSPAQ